MSTAPPRGIQSSCATSSWSITSGVAQAITDQRRDYWRPLISPDGTRVAVEVFDGNARHIWVVSVATGVSTQITFTGFLDDFLTWTPDGKSLVFSSTVDGARRLFRKHLEGGDAEALGVTGEAVPTDVSRDDTLLYSMGDQTAERAIWTLSLSDRKPVEILATPAQEHHAKFSPDGRWLAYASNAVGAAGGLRPTVSDRAGHGAASLGRRWRRAGVGAGRVGALLSRSASADESPRPRSDRASCRGALAPCFHMSDSGFPATRRRSTSILTASGSSW